MGISQISQDSDETPLSRILYSHEKAEPFPHTSYDHMHPVRCQCWPVQIFSAFSFISLSPPTPFPFLTELPVCTRKPQNCGLQGQSLQVSGSGVLTLTALELGLPAPSPSLSSGNLSPEKPDLLVGMPLSPSCQATAWCTPATKVLSLTPATVFPLHQRC